MKKLFIVIAFLIAWLSKLMPFVENYSLQFLGLTHLVLS